MRQYMMAIASAVGLLALWAAILPLTAEPATAPVAAAQVAMSKAHFLCRSPNGPNQACVAALAKALVLDARADASTRINDRSCRANQGTLATLRRRD